MKVIIILMVLLLVSLTACSPQTIEEGCMDSCRDAHGCFFSKCSPGDIECENTRKECKIKCWEICYVDIINKTK